VLVAFLKPWTNPQAAGSGPTFNDTYPTEFRASSIPGAGNGWFVKDTAIPANTRLRRLCCADGTLPAFGSYEELITKTGWDDFYETVHYGVGLATGGYTKDSAKNYFLNPGTACNRE
jgi:hypothetical protein